MAFHRFRSHSGNSLVQNTGRLGKQRILYIVVRMAGACLFDSRLIHLAYCEIISRCYVPLFVHKSHKRTPAVHRTVMMVEHTCPAFCPADLRTDSNVLPKQSTFKLSIPLRIDQPSPSPYQYTYSQPPDPVPASQAPASTSQAVSSPSSPTDDPKQ